jgi:hypothetical protein
MLLLVFRKCRAMAALLWGRIATEKVKTDLATSLDVTDEMEPSFPVELAIEGVPLSLQASGRSKEAWKEEIRDAVDGTLDPSAF